MLQAKYYSIYSLFCKPRDMWIEKPNKPTVTLSGYCSHWAGAHRQLTVEAIWNLWLKAPGASERVGAVSREGLSCSLRWSGQGPVPQWRTTLPHLVNQPCKIHPWWQQTWQVRLSSSSLLRSSLWVAPAFLLWNPNQQESSLLSLQLNLLQLHSTPHIPKEGTKGLTINTNLIIAMTVAISQTLTSNLNNLIYLVFI